MGYFKAHLFEFSSFSSSFLSLFFPEARGLGDPGWHYMARNEAQKQRLPASSQLSAPSHQPFPVPSYSFPTKAPFSCPCTWPRPTFPFPASPPLPTCLYIHEVAVEVHLGLQSLAPQPMQELFNEPTAVLEAAPAATPLPGLVVLQVGASTRASAPCGLCCMPWPAEEIHGVRESHLPEALIGKAGLAAALQATVLALEREPAPAPLRSHVD